jgi:hypothetical protein
MPSFYRKMGAACCYEFVKREADAECGSKTEPVAGAGGIVSLALKRAHESDDRLTIALQFRVISVRRHTAPLQQ